MRLFISRNPLLRSRGFFENAAVSFSRRRFSAQLRKETPHNFPRERKNLKSAIHIAALLCLAASLDAPIATAFQNSARPRRRSLRAHGHANCVHRQNRAADDGRGAPAGTALRSIHDCRKSHGRQTLSISPQTMRAGRASIAERASFELDMLAANAIAQRFHRELLRTGKS